MWFVVMRFWMALSDVGRGLWSRDAWEEGQSMVEYAIVAALVAIAAMGAIQAMGGGIANVFQHILAKIGGLG